MADPTIFEYQLQDDQGVKSRSSVYVAYNAATSTVASLQGAWAEIGGLLDAVTDAEIIEGRITIPFAPDPAWKTAPIEGNNVNQVMVLDFENDFNRYLTPILIPAYRESTLLPNGDPDLADTALAAFISQIIDDAGTVFVNSRDLHQIDALRKAFLTVRKLKGNRALTTVTP